MPDVTSDDVAIGTYFSGAGSVMPDYQREFAWTKSHSSRLFESLDLFLQKNPQTNYANANPPPPISRFYLGSIITVEDGNNPIPIVDGQQRLTSLTITAAVLRDYCISRGDYLSAHKLDTTFCWQLLESVPNPGSFVYSGGMPKITLRDTGNASFNLRNNMKNVCSLEITNAGNYEVTNITPNSPQVGMDQLRLDQDLNWTLPEGMEPHFNVAGRVSLLKTAEIGHNRIVVPHGSVALNETFTLNYGRKLGLAPAQNTPIDLAHKALINVVTETLDARYPPPAGVPAGGHLPQLSNYISEFVTLMSQTKVTQIEFASSVEAMSHFMIVNDSTLRVGLSDIDRLRALSEIVAGSPLQTPPHGETPPAGLTWDQAIRNKFQMIEDLLLNTREKDHAIQKKFFYQFGQVYANREQCPAGDVIVNIEPELHTAWRNVDGEWKKNKFLDFLNLIYDFAGIYFRAVEPWTNAAARPASYLHTSNARPHISNRYERNEEFFTTVLRESSKSFIQWIPTYIAGNYLARKSKDSTTANTVTAQQYSDLMTTLLKALTKLHVYGTLYAKSTGQNNITSGHWHSLSDKFCQQLKNVRNAANGLQKTEIEAAFNDILDRINGEIECTVAEPKLDQAIVLQPWPNRVYLDNSKALPFLMLAEWEQSGYMTWNAGNPRAYAHFFGSEREVEHIQPNSLPTSATHWPLPRSGHRGGWTAEDPEEWEDNRNRLGNRLNIKKPINSHIQDRELSFKIGSRGGGCPIRGPCTGHQRHYLSDNHQLTDHWMVARGPTGWFENTSKRKKPCNRWGLDEIDSWENVILDLADDILG